MSGSDSTYAAIFGDGGTVLERVLLAIINAHTTPTTDGRQLERLDAAMNALTGADWPANPAHDAVLGKALDFMARERQRDICDRDMDMLRAGGGKVRPVRPVRELATMCAVRSVSELASVAARKVMGCSTADEVQATASVLCDLFRNRGKAFGVEPDHGREVLEVEAVRRILGELAEWGAPTRF